MLWEGYVREIACVCARVVEEAVAVTVSDREGMLLSYFIYASAYICFTGTESWLTQRALAINQNIFGQKAKFLTDRYVCSPARENACERFVQQIQNRPLKSMFICEATAWTLSLMNTSKLYAFGSRCAGRADGVLLDGII